MLVGRERADITVVAKEVGVGDVEVFLVRVDDKREREAE